MAKVAKNALLTKRTRELAAQFTKIAREEGLIASDQRISFVGRVCTVPKKKVYGVSTSLVTRMCQARYKGRYIRPAALDSLEIQAVLSSIMYRPVRLELQKLLDGGNVPSEIHSDATTFINQNLSSPVRGVHYRIGTNKDGLKHLWVVEPPKTVANINQAVLPFTAKADD